MRLSKKKLISGQNYARVGYVSKSQLMVLGMSVPYIIRQLFKDNEKKEKLNGWKFIVSDFAKRHTKIWSFQ